MYKRILRKRILKGLVVSLALFAVIPMTNAAAKPVSVGQPDPWFQTLLANQRYQESQVGPTKQELAAMNARGEGLNKKYNLGQYAFGPTKQELAAMNARGVGMNKLYNLGQFAVTPEITDGINSPNETPAASGSDFQWDTTGLGVGIAALLIVTAGTALVVRNRHQGTLAH